MALENEKYTTQKEQYDIVRKEIERLNKEKENLTNIVANKIIKDYDIETPLKDALNKERIKNENLGVANNILNNSIKEVREYLQARYDGEVLTHTFDKDNVKELLEIVDKVGETDVKD